MVSFGVYNYDVTISIFRHFIEVISKIAIKTLIFFYIMQDDLESCPSTGKLIM